MNIPKNIMAVFVVLACLGCEKQESKKEKVVSTVADKAYSLARENSVDFSQYSLQSVQLLRDGQMGTIDDFAKDEYISSIREKLKNKKYWEACYMVTSDMVLGAKYCYYFEHSKLDYLTTYSVK